MKEQNNPLIEAWLDIIFQHLSPQITDGQTGIKLYKKRGNWGIDWIQRENNRDLAIAEEWISSILNDLHRSPAQQLESDRLTIDISDAGVVLKKEMDEIYELLSLRMIQSKIHRTLYREYNFNIHHKKALLRRAKMMDRWTETIIWPMASSSHEIIQIESQYPGLWELGEILHQHLPTEYKLFRSPHCCAIFDPWGPILWYNTP